MAKVVKRILDISFVIAMVLLVIYFVLRLTNVIEIYSVETGSMEENIHPGDYVLVYKKDDYNVNDIITFRKEHYLVTHRVIRKENNSYITKGDANNTEDEAISKEYIVGKVILIGGLLNLVIQFKYTIIGVFLILYLFSCYFEKSEKNDIIKDDSKE